MRGGPPDGGSSGPVRADPGLRVDPVRVGGGRGSVGAGFAVVTFVAALAIVVSLGAALVNPWSTETPATRAIAVAEGSSPLAASTPVAAAVPRPLAPVAANRPIRVAAWPGLVADLDHLGGQPIVSARDIGGSDGDGTCGGSARITPFDAVIGIAADPAERVVAVRLFAIDTIRRPDVVTAISRDRSASHDGITIVTLPPGGIAARQYALIADSVGANGADRLTYTVCVG